MRFSPFLNVTFPPYCQCHSAPSVPKVSGAGFPLTRTRNLPGDSSLPQVRVQSLVLTQRLYVPPSSEHTVVEASATGTPIPCAIRYGDPIEAIDCWSRTQPPYDSMLSASIRISSEGTAGLALAIRARAETITNESFNRLLFIALIVNIFSQIDFLFILVTESILDLHITSRF